MNIQKLSKALPAAAVILMAGLTVSCQRELSVNSAIAKADNNIRLTIEGEKNQGTSKGTVDAVAESKELKPVVLESNGRTLTFSVTCKPNTSGVRVNDLDTSGTKGKCITSENIITERSENINLVAYQDGEEDWQNCYIPTKTLMYSKWYDEAEHISEWKFKDGSSYSWPSCRLRFFAWSPSDILTVSESSFELSKGIINLPYTMPVPSESRRDAESMQDLLLASTINAFNDNNSIVHLHFDHILSALHFCIGKNEGMQVISVTLENIISEGSVSYDPSETVRPVDWLIPEEVATYTYVQSYTEEEGTIDPDDEYQPGTGMVPHRIGPESTTFMVIPQKSGVTVPDKVKLSIAFLIDGNDDPVVFEAVLDEDNADWQPGMEYYYTLNSAQELIVSVDDKVTGLVKSDLMIVNEDESQVACYMRACIYGNWFDAEGNILGPWFANEGGFDDTFPTEVGVAKNNWMLASDGFYYYKYPVYPGMLTGQTESDPDGDPLFQTYTSPSVPLIQDSHLVMKIGAQGVRYESNKASAQKAWANVWSEIAEFLSVEDKE